MTEMIPLSTTDRLRVITDAERRNAQKIEQYLLRICEAIFNYKEAPNMSKRTEALASIKAMDDTIITAEDAAAALGVNPQSIRLQAEEEPNALGFNVIRIGRSTLIPRVPFVRYLEGAME